MRIVTATCFALSLAAAFGCHRVKTEPQGTERTAPAPTSYGGGPSTEGTSENKQNMDYDQNVDKAPVEKTPNVDYDQQNVENKSDGNMQGDGNKTAGPMDQAGGTSGGTDINNQSGGSDVNNQSSGTDINNQSSSSDTSNSSRDLGQGGGPAGGDGGMSKDAGPPPKDGGAKSPMDMSPYSSPPYDQKGSTGIP
ncbi:MAG: hypothetical protein ACXWUG_10575 [Polyangiales bacterium]